MDSREPRTKSYKRRFFSSLYERGLWLGKPSVGVPISEGVSEMSLAAALEPFPRTLGMKTFSFIPLFTQNRSIIHSRHGLSLIPTDALTTGIWGDLWVIPSGPRPPNDFMNWIKHNGENTGGITADFSNKLPGETQAGVMSLLKNQQGARITRIVEKMMEISPVSPDGTEGNLLLKLWARALGIGALGALIARLLMARMTTKLATKPAPKLKRRSAKSAQ